MGSQLYWDGGIQDKLGWSEVDSSELVFAHDLVSDPITGWFEQKKILNRKNRTVLQIKKLPKTGPGYFSNGAKAIALAYEETKRRLNQRA
jgi:hypothetical protein